MSMRPAEAAGQRASVVVIEDDPQIRRFMRAGLSPHGFDIHEAEGGQTGLTEIAHRKPDVIILDLGLPDVDGIDLIKLINEKCPDAHSIVISTFGDAKHVMRSLRSGASGYLLKEEIQPSLIDKIIATHNGHAPLSPAVSRLVLDKLESLETGVKPKVDKAQKLKELGLGQREWSVLNLLIEGLPIVDIGSRLSISRFTVNQHLRSIYRKLNVNSRAMATSVARLHGLIDD